MGMKHSPHIAAITNLTPNHLDYHKDFDEYVQAKTAIYRSQTDGDRLVLNLDDEVTRTLKASGNLFCTSKTQELANGVFLKDGIIYIAEGGARRELMPAADIRIPGAHNVYNMMMAAAVVQGYASDDDIRAVATTFGGVEHPALSSCAKRTASSITTTRSRPARRARSRASIPSSRRSSSSRAATTSISRMTCWVSRSASTSSFCS